MPYNALSRWLCLAGVKCALKPGNQCNPRQNGHCGLRRASDGLALNNQLRSVVPPCRKPPAVAHYRLYALADGKRPGMVRTLEQGQLSRLSVGRRTAKWDHFWPVFPRLWG
jgi:hypothetical protein